MPFVTANLLVQEITDCEKVFGDDSLMNVKECSQVLILAYCNCRHSLKAAAGNLKLPTGTLVHQINTLSSDEDSRLGYHEVLREVLGKVVGSQALQEAMEKVNHF
jgi:hypothetical protein